MLIVIAAVVILVLSLGALAVLWAIGAGNDVEPPHPEHCDCGACNRRLAEQEFQRARRARR